MTITTFNRMPQYAEWTDRRLADLAAFEKGHVVVCQPNPVTGSRPYIGANSFTGVFSQFTTDPVAVLCEPTDVLMLWDGERSGLCATGLCGAIGSTVAHLRPKSGIDVRFLYHQLARHFAWIQARRTGTGIPHVPKDLGNALFLPLPPDSAEQSRIAAVLDTVDEAIAKTEAVIAKLKQVRAGLLHDLLTRGLDENGQLRDPIAHPEQFQDSPIGRIPRGWEVGPFRMFGSPNRPYLKTGPFGSSLKQEHWVLEGVPVVTIGSLGEGEFIHSELLYVSEETAHLLSAYSLLPGDIVFSRVADVGRSVVVTEAGRGWIMSSNMMWISLDQRKADPDYVQTNLATNGVLRAQIRKLVNAAGRDVANAPVMNSLLLPWAPIDEQKRIIATLRSADDCLHDERAELNKLQLLRQALMTDLLTGRVRVPADLDFD